MKIAFDHYAFTMQSVGGISRYFISLADQFVKLNSDFKIFAGYSDNSYLDKISREFCDFKKAPYFPNRVRFIFSIINELENRRKIRDWQPNILHQTYYSSYRKKVLCAKVITVHDMIHEIFKSDFKFNDSTAKNKKISIENADHIIAISNNTKNDLVSLLNVNPSKISVIYHGVDKRIFSRPEILKNINVPYILYVGSRGGYKNFSTLLIACSISKKIKNNIKIIAFGGGFFTSSEKLLIKNLGFTDGIVENRFGDDNDLSNFYSNATCFVYPSLYEGFGLPLLEAMVCGCPVISSNSSSMPEVVNGAGILFDPHSPDSLSHAIEKMLFDSEARREYINLGYKNSDLFSWEKTSAATLDLYKKLC